MQRGEIGRRDREERNGERGKEGKENMNYGGTYITGSLCINCSGRTTP